MQAAAGRNRRALEAIARLVKFTGMDEQQGKNKTKRNETTTTTKNRKKNKKNTKTKSKKRLRESEEMGYSSRRIS
jgi:hypothetical protein